MLICRDPGLFFIKTMKTAGSSIEIALGPLLKEGDLATPLYPDEERARPGRNVRRAVRRMVATLRERSDGALRARYPHYGYEVAAAYLPDEIRGCYSFCVERNPYDKAISAFHFVYSRHNRRITDLGQQFEEFCKSARLASFSNFEMYTRDGELVVDRVLQYDKLHAQFAEVVKHLGADGVSLEGKSAKAGVRPKLDLSAYYGPNYERPAAKLVEAVFAREIEFFGYRKTCPENAS